MKILVDSANLVEIEEALERGFPAGITTNPSILAKEEKADFREHMKKIIELVQRYGYDIPLSVEVFSTRPEEMIEQAGNHPSVFAWSVLTAFSGMARSFGQPQEGARDDRDAEPEEAHVYCSDQRVGNQRAAAGLEERSSRHHRR